MVLEGREGMERTLITMDGEKVHRNLSGEDEWKEREGIRGDDGPRKKKFWKEKGRGSRGDREKEDEGRVWSCRVVRGREEGEGERWTCRVSVRVRDCK